MGSLPHLKSSTGRLPTPEELLFFSTLTALQTSSNEMSFHVIFSSPPTWRVSLSKLSNILGSCWLCILQKCSIHLFLCCFSVNNVVPDLPLTWIDVIFQSAVRCLFYMASLYHYLWLHTLLDCIIPGSLCSYLSCNSF